MVGNANKQAQSNEMICHWMHGLSSLPLQRSEIPVQTTVPFQSDCLQFSPPTHFILANEEATSFHRPRNIPTEDLLAVE